MRGNSHVKLFCISCGTKKKKPFDEFIGLLRRQEYTHCWNPLFLVRCRMALIKIWNLEKSHSYGGTGRMTMIGQHLPSSHSRQWQQHECFRRCPEWFLQQDRGAPYMVHYGTCRKALPFFSSIKNFFYHPSLCGYNGDWAAMLHSSSGGGGLTLLVQANLPYQFHDLP